MLIHSVLEDISGKSYHNMVNGEVISEALLADPFMKNLLDGKLALVFILTGPTPTFHCDFVWKSALLHIKPQQEAVGVA